MLDILFFFILYLCISDLEKIRIQHLEKLSLGHLNCVNIFASFENLSFSCSDALVGDQDNDADPNYLMNSRNN